MFLRSSGEDSIVGGRVQDQERAEVTKSIADAIAESSDTDYVPVTFESCDHVEGPSHGTKTAFDVGDRLVPGSLSNYHEGRISNHVPTPQPCSNHPSGRPNSLARSRGAGAHLCR